jgi:hypothetical protein
MTKQSSGVNEENYQYLHQVNKQELKKIYRIM